MGDNGSLYAVFTDAFAPAMAKLCGRADVIVPNITEACLLLNKPYHEGPYTQKEIDDLLVGLSALGPKQIVLTGVYFDAKSLGAATLDVKSGKREFVLRSKLEGMYHGTGDVYASALTAALLRGFALEDAAGVAADFTVASIRATQDLADNIHYGVNFEQCIPQLLCMLEKEIEK